MQIEIREMPAMRCLAVRHVGPFPTIGASFGKLFQYLSSHPVEHGPALGFFYGDPHETPPEELQSDAAVVLIEGASSPELGRDPLEGEVHTVTTEPARYAVWTHVGPYSGLPDAWNQFMRAFGEGGFGYAPGKCFEMYMNDMNEVPQDQLITELYLPIA